MADEMLENALRYAEQGYHDLHADIWQAYALAMTVNDLEDEYAW